MIKSIKNCKAALLVAVSLMIGATASAQQAEIENSANDNFTSFGYYWVQATMGVRSDDNSDDFMPRFTGNIPVYKGDVFGVDLRGSISYSSSDSSTYDDGFRKGTSKHAATVSNNKVTKDNINKAQKDALAEWVESASPYKTSETTTDTFTLSLYAIPSWKVLNDENFAITCFASTGFEFLFTSTETTNYGKRNGTRQHDGTAGTIRNWDSSTRYYYTSDTLVNTGTTSDDNTEVFVDFRVGAEFVFYKCFQVTPYLGYMAGSESDLNTAVLGVDLGVRLGAGIAIIGNIEYLEEYEATIALAGVRYTF